MEPYKSAIKFVNLKLLSRKYYIMTFLARKKAYHLLWYICNIKEIIDKIRYKGDIVR